MSRLSATQSRDCSNLFLRPGTAANWPSVEAAFTDSSVARVAEGSVLKLNCKYSLSISSRLSLALDEVCS